MSKGRVVLGYSWHWYTWGGFPYVLSRMVSDLERHDWDVEIEQACGVYVPGQHEEIAALALYQHKADYVVILGDDTLCEPNSARRLVEHDLPVVAYEMSTKTRSLKALSGSGARDSLIRSTVQLLDGEKLDDDYRDSHPLSPVRRVGSGFICFKIHESLEKLAHPWFEWDGLSADYCLCDKLTTAGIPIHVDFTREIEHIGMRSFTIKDIDDTIDVLGIFQETPHGEERSPLCDGPSS